MGKTWEDWQDMIEDAFVSLESPTSTVIRVEPPMKIIKKMGRKGQFLATYKRRGACDFEGAWCGLPVSLDAKETKQERFYLSAVKDNQVRRMVCTDAMGGIAGLVIRFRGEKDTMGFMPFHVLQSLAEAGVKSFAPEALPCPLQYGDIAGGLKRWLDNAALTNLKKG